MNRILSTETADKVGQEVLLKGWVNARRNMGKIVFLDLRDREGIVQVVGVPSELDEQSVELLKDVRPEWVLEIHGVVNERGAKQKNPDMPTGNVEVLMKKLVILNTAETPPFEIDKDTKGIGEELRLKYRYLDLRSQRMLKNLVLRDKVETFFREYLHAKNFIEVETPNLTKGTPEGSREFLVPSRIHPGQMYVLPQSPQQFKQLLMVGGVEKYFQVARCFRDEDQRGDRQPEFTQLDLEMSFVEREDVLNLVENMMVEMVAKIAPEKKIQTVPFPRITYKEAMEKYNSDKPDLRADKNDQNSFAFEWVVDFPMFEKADDGSVQAVHHPFTSPLPEDAELLAVDPFKVRANAYDLVLNGNEIFGGSIRIHKRDLQNKVFELLGLDAETIQQRFGHILEAFTFGAPPHGGIASGIDRILMILANEENIREVIPFPKTGDARDLMMNAPSPMPDKALKDVHIKIDK